MREVHFDRKIRIKLFKKQCAYCDKRIRIRARGMFILAEKSESKSKVLTVTKESGSKMRRDAYLDREDVSLVSGADDGHRAVQEGIPDDDLYII